MVFHLRRTIGSIIMCDIESEIFHECFAESIMILFSLLGWIQIELETNLLRCILQTFSLIKHHSKSSDVSNFHRTDRNVFRFHLFHHKSTPDWTKSRFIHFWISLIERQYLLRCPVQFDPLTLPAVAVLQSVLTETSFCGAEATFLAMSLCPFRQH
jgi:hypothetical protein